jgi:uncharacterized membrane protein YbhN (UPF0104 family)
VRDRLAGARPAWVVAVVAFQLASELCFVACFYGVFARRLPKRVAYNIGMVEQGANVMLPTGGAGGVALGAVALQRAGYDADRVAARSIALFLITSASSVVTLAVVGLVTAAGLLGGGVPLSLSLVPGLLGVAAIVGVILAPRLLPVSRDGLRGGRIRRTAMRIRMALRGGVSDALALLGSGDRLIIAGSLGYLWFDIASLAAAFQAFGGGGPVFGGFILAYILGQLGALIPIPGGLGGTDGGLIGFMVLYGAPAGAAAAAVLAFRVFMLGIPAVLGSIAFSRLGGDVRRLAAERP